MTLRRLIPQLLLPIGLLLGAEKQRVLKPGWNLFSPDQDVQMGREYAQQVERQFQVINDPVLHNYVNLNIGLHLALVQAAAYFFQWTIVGTVIGLIYKPRATP